MKSEGMNVCGVKTEREGKVRGKGAFKRF